MTIPAGYGQVSSGFYMKHDDASGPYVFDGVTMALVGTGGGSDYLGVYTWSDLQTAYPNGGAALLALATGVTATVGSGLWTPNFDKSRWVPIGGRVSLYSRVALLSSYVARVVGNGTVQLFVPPETLLIPAGMLGPGIRIGVAGRMRRTAWAATGAAQVTVRLGTVGNSTDATVMAVNIPGSLNAMWEMYDSITLLDANTVARDTYVGRMIGTPFAAGNFASLTSNINTAADMYVSFAVSATYVASDTVDLHEYNIWLEYGA